MNLSPMGGNSLDRGTSHVACKANHARMPLRRLGKMRDEGPKIATRDEGRWSADTYARAHRDLEASCNRQRHTLQSRETTNKTKQNISDAETPKADEGASKQNADDSFACGARGRPRRRGRYGAAPAVGPHKGRTGHERALIEVSGLRCAEGSPQGCHAQTTVCTPVCANAQPGPLCSDTSPDRKSRS